MIFIQADENKYRHFWVIPDVHGCAMTLTKLIETIDLQANDGLIFLGDLINRGPDSAKVLEIVQDIKSKLGFFAALLGNHEEQFLQNRDLGRNNLRQNKKTIKQALDFFKKMPRYVSLESTLCVHAGFDFLHAKPFEEIHAMCWIRSFEPDPIITRFRSVIHGHSPTSMMAIKQKIDSFDWRIPLDNGCVFKNRENMGKLLAFELHSRNLIEIQNCEEPI